MQFQMGQLEDILLYLKSWWWNTNIKQTGVILIWSCGMRCFYSNGFLLPSHSKLRNSKQELEELFPGQHSCCSLCWWLHTSTSQWWKASITYPGCATAISTLSFLHAAMAQDPILQRGWTGRCRKLHCEYFELLFASALEKSAWM